MALIDDWTRYLDVRGLRRHNALSRRRIIDHMKIVNTKTQDRVMVGAADLLKVLSRRRWSCVAAYGRDRWVWRVWR